MTNSGPATYMQSGNAMVRVKSFGEALRMLREETGITYRDLANLVGCNKTDVRDWEEGKASPDGKQMGKLFSTFPRLKHFAHAFKKAQDENALALVVSDPATALDAIVGGPKPQEPPKTFGEALKRARVHEGMDHADVASAIDWNDEAIVKALEADDSVILYESNYNKLLDLFPILNSAPKPKITPDPEPPKPVEPAPATDPVNDSKKKIKSIEEAGTRFAIALKKMAEARAACESAKQVYEQAKMAQGTAQDGVIAAQKRLFEVTGQGIMSDMNDIGISLHLKKP